MKIKCRVEMAKGTFQKMSKIFNLHDFSFGTKMLHIYYSIIWSRNIDIILTETLNRRIEALEIWS